MRGAPQTCRLGHVGSERPLLLVAVLLLSTTGAQAQDSGASGTTLDRRLDNGMRILIRSRPGGGRVGYALTFGVGMGDDPRRLGSLAHVAEHAMFEGSGAAEPAPFAQHMAELGAREFNARTTMDRTMFHAEVPAGALETALWLEADRFAFVLTRLDESDVVHVKTIVEREELLRGLRQPFWLAFSEGLFGSEHRYGRTHAARDVRRIELEDVQWFIQRYYDPANATLAIVGDIDAEAALSSVQRTLGRLVSRGRVPDRAPQPTDTGRDRWVTVHSRHTERVRIGWRVPADSPEGPALDVLSSLLYEELFRQLPWQSMRRVRLGYVEQEHGSAFILTFGNPVPPLDRELLEGLNRALHLVCGQDVPRGRFERARNEWAQYERDQWNDRVELAVRLSVSGTSGRNGSLDAGLTRYKTLEQTDLARACEKHLGRENRTILYQGRSVSRWAD